MATAEQHTWYETITSFWTDEDRQLWSQLISYLLRWDGEAVVPPLHGEDDLRLLVASTRWFTEPARLVAGERRDCHANAARLHRSGTATAIGTGYALSGDGLWRQHSWAFDAGGIIETTELRTMYCGVRLQGEHAETFAAQQLDPDPARDTETPPQGSAGSGERPEPPTTGP
jgi:hypothetical protein